MPQGQSVSGGITVDGKPLDVDSTVAPSRDAAPPGQPLSIPAILEKWGREAFDALIGRNRPNIPYGTPDPNAIKIKFEPGDWTITRTDHEAPKGQQISVKKFKF